MPASISLTLSVYGCAQGKVGQDLAVAAHRQDRELNNDGQNGDILTRHGDFNQPPLDCSASLNRLTYGECDCGYPPWTACDRPPLLDCNTLADVRG